MISKNKNLIHLCGLLGIVSFISYAAAVIFAPLAYPGYDWLSQAVSDLSATSSPSAALWTQLSSLYGIAGVTCLMMVCASVRGNPNNRLRTGIYLFTLMFWVSTAGYSMFPLTESGGGATFQDTMHLVVTGVVVVLSIVSLTLIILGKSGSLSKCAAAALALMFIGAIGTGIAPPEYFGLFQRFSNLIAVNGFLTVLGLYLFAGRFDKDFL